MVTFVGNVTFKLGFDLKNLYNKIDNIYCFILIFGNFPNQFDNFSELSIITKKLVLMCAKLEHTAKKQLYLVLY